MNNIRRAAQQFCKPNEIFMIVDGDDELLGSQVFKVFNSVFQSKEVWFAYSNFIGTAYRIGFSRPIPSFVLRENKYRKYPFVTSHLRAFYTKLLLNIKTEDMQDQKGVYFRAANDVAICVPVVQQSGERVAYIPELLYLYNPSTGQNNHSVRKYEQTANAAYIRNKKRYERLEALF